MQSELRMSDDFECGCHIMTAKHLHVSFDQFSQESRNATGVSQVTNQFSVSQALRTQWWFLSCLIWILCYSLFMYYLICDFLRHLPRNAPFKTFCLLQCSVLQAIQFCIFLTVWTGKTLNSSCVSLLFKCQQPFFKTWCASSQSCILTPIPAGRQFQNYFIRDPL